MTSRSTSCSRLAAALLVVAGCGAGGGGGDGAQTGLDDLELKSVQPQSVVPGTVLDVAGRSFVDATYGQSRLRLTGKLDGRDVNVALPAKFVDYDKLQVKMDRATIGLLPVASGRFSGQASVEVESSVDHTVHASVARQLTLDLSPALTPRLDTLDRSTVIYVNQPISVEGDGLLLGGGEGTTLAVIHGCFEPEAGGDCVDVDEQQVAVTPADPYDRTAGTFAFAPAIAGIQPGTFRATVTLRNSTGGESGDATAEWAILRPNVEMVTPDSASLGQYIDIHGGGFVGGDDGQTELQLKGKLTIAGHQAAVDVLVIPAFESGPLVRYVLNENDAIGRALDLRKQTGSFSGTITPIIEVGSDRVVGDTTPIAFDIAPVKQVIYIHFLPSYVESLREFGLRGLDAQVRARVLEVARRDYATVNVEFREEPPTDFALFEQVNIAGPDPSQTGLLGYDNTPGKDDDNQRLFDRIGGVNATTQEDGSNGYGGVFIESMFAFSKHPNGHAKPVPDADDIFDKIFDSIRLDSGKPITAADLSASGLKVLHSSKGCPAAADDRGAVASCAVFVMGSLIGTTMTHEIGHSLGLANPHADGFHDFGDEPNRIMDAGGARPFRERAELDGLGPARFCDDEYAYLRQILPTAEPDDTSERPSCF